MADFTGSYSNQGVVFDLKDLGKINYFLKEPENYSEESIFLIMKNHEVVGLSLGKVDSTDADTSYVEIVLPENFIVTDFFYFLTKCMIQSGYKINVEYEMKISQTS